MTDTGNNIGLSFFLQKFSNSEGTPSYGNIQTFDYSFFEAALNDYQNNTDIKEDKSDASVFSKYLTQIITGNDEIDESSDVYQEVLSYVNYASEESELGFDENEVYDKDEALFIQMPIINKKALISDYPWYLKPEVSPFWTEETETLLKQAGLADSYVESLKYDNCDTEDYSAIFELKKMDFSDETLYACAQNASIVKELVDNINVESIRELLDYPNVANNIDIFADLIPKALETGLDIKTIGLALNNLNTSSSKEILQTRMDILKNMSLSELKEIYTVASQQNSLTHFSDAAENFDKFDYLIHGEVLDPKLQTDVQSIGDKYGINIRIDSDTISVSCKGNRYPSSKIITDGYLTTLDETLKYMQDNNITIPENIYITDMIEYFASGTFCPKNPNDITLSTKMYRVDMLKEAILHETSHTDDFCQDSGNYTSSQNAEMFGIDPRKKLDCITFEDGSIVNSHDISMIISGYATTNIHEFIAEVGTLLKAGAIVKNELGIYNIDESKIICGYCKGWIADNENRQLQLQNIMRLYDTLMV